MHYFSGSTNNALAAMLLLLSSYATMAIAQSQSGQERGKSTAATRLLRRRELVSTSDTTLPLKQPRIIGGEVAGPGRFPYYALMNGSNLCGAVLISPRFVVTAAHCQDADRDFSVNTVTRRIGDEIGVVDRAVHPLYDDFTYSNDVAIFELAEDAVNPDGTPAAFVRLNRDPIDTVGTAMTVIGYGDIDPDEEVTLFADALNRVDVKYVSNEECNRNHRGEIDSKMMCAKDDGKDACYGDSGGPLLLTPNEADYTEDTLVGIVSWGRGCANENFPGVYTRISEFYDWIAGTTCVLNADKAPPYVDCDAILGIDVSEVFGNQLEVENREEEISQLQEDEPMMPLPVATAVPTLAPVATAVPTLAPVPALTGAPVPAPVAAPIAAPVAAPTPATPACGDRGDACASATDCCSGRCNLFSMVCYPPTTGTRDRISSGMGGSGGGSSILRLKNTARGGFD